MDLHQRLDYRITIIKRMLDIFENGSKSQDPDDAEGYKRLYDKYTLVLEELQKLKQ